MKKKSKIPREVGRELEEETAGVCDIRVHLELGIDEENDDDETDEAD